MKTRLLLVVLAVSVLMIPATALSAESNFNPNTQYYDMSSEGVLNLWGIPEANGNAVKANPDYGWPSEFTVAAWYATILGSYAIHGSIQIV